MAPLAELVSGLGEVLGEAEVPQEPGTRSGCYAGGQWLNAIIDTKKGPHGVPLGWGVARTPQCEAVAARSDQASCWSMKAVSWALLRAPTLVAAS